MKKNLAKRLSYLLMVVLVLAMTVLTGCSKDAAKANTNTEASAEANVVGEGNTQFTFKVVDMDGAETVFTVKTDETTVGAALLNAGLIAGDETEYGLYVKTVNGVVADYDVDQTFWGFYIDDEFASTGVDSTPLNPESVYTFKKQK
ncbi:MAG: DUF4430 domain-containing protein [Lachnospiraceae bacterium]|nr:DUF4430 domain-containing protein [Lachnospiraceae bacterium]